MVDSERINPEWVARNSNMAVQVSEIAANTDAAISDTIMQGGKAVERSMTA
jgi:hypothetical protein